MASLPRARRRVLVVGGSLNAHGGVERYCCRLANALRSNSPFAVSWLPADSSFSTAQTALGYVRSLCASTRRLRAALRELDPQRDLVWVQQGNGVDLLFLPLLRIWFTGPLLCTVHVGEQWRHLRNSLFRRVSAALLRIPDQVCVLSSAQEVALSALGITPARIPTLLPEWVNSQPAEAADQPARAGIVYFGRLSESKGIGDLLRAFQLVAQHRPTAFLHIAGTGERDHQWKQTAADLGLDSRITWYGFLTEEQLYPLLQRSQLLVYPSYADAYPLSVLEGFASGLRVVAYDIPGTRELLEEFGGTGVPLGDVRALATAMWAALDNPPPALTASRDTANLFSWHRAVRTYTHIIHSVSHA